MLINYIKNIDNSNSHGKSCLLIAIGTWLEKSKKNRQFCKILPVPYDKISRENKTAIEPTILIGRRIVLLINKYIAKKG